jgi:hypothetical protein
MGQLRAWWRETLRPEAGTKVASLAAALVLAVVLGVVLGTSVLILIVVSVALSWLAALAEQREASGSRTRPEHETLAEQREAGGSRTRPEQATLTRAERETQGAAVWRALGEFSIPWLIGASIMGRVSGTVILLAVCYSVAYFGLIRPARSFRLAAAGQATAALLLAGLRYPLAAGAAAILLMPQWGLFRLETKLLGENPVSNSPGGRPQGSPLQSTATRYVQPFIIVSMVLAALAIAP